MIDLICIGTELLNGKTRDSNGHFLAKQGAQIRKVHIIADDEKLIFEALEEARKNSAAVILSGGLGPTKDDITKSALAKFFKLELKNTHLKEAKAIFDQHSREYDTDIFHYHIVPSGFDTLNNSVGYAPGLYFKENQFQLFSLPGVPAEFQKMLTEEVLPKLDILDQNENIVFKTWKVPESKIFNQVDPSLWDKLQNFGEVTSLPHTYGVDIGVKLKSNDLKDELINLVTNGALSEFIYHVGNHSLEEIIIEKAKAKNLTFGFTESCTGGLLASRITDISGCSSVFWGSITAYDNSVKMNSLGVKEQTLIDHGAVSEQTAFEMAKGAREKLAVDIVISTTGVAGPGGGSKEKPVGTIGIGVSTKNETTSKLYHFKGDRLALKKRFSDFALIKLLETILSA